MSAAPCPRYGVALGPGRPAGCLPLPVRVTEWCWDRTALCQRYGVVLGPGRTVRTLPDHTGTPEDGASIPAPSVERADRSRGVSAPRISDRPALFRECSRPRSARGCSGCPPSGLCAARGADRASFSVANPPPRHASSAAGRTRRQGHNRGEEIDKERLNL